MNTYLDVLQQKAQKLGANIDDCGYDKECIKDILASTVRKNLETEDLQVIKEKALTIQADFSDTSENKDVLLDAIEAKVKEILEEENEHYSSIEAQQNFMPLDLG